MTWCVEPISLVLLAKIILCVVHQVANKKGVSRSLLSATKRLFGSPRPASGSMTATGFAADAPELQLRRLGDLYFLFGSYANAFQVCRDSFELSLIIIVF